MVLLAALHIYKQPRSFQAEDYKSPGHPPWVHLGSWMWRIPHLPVLLSVCRLCSYDHFTCVYELFLSRLLLPLWEAVITRRFLLQVHAATLSWLVLCVNLTGLRDTQRAGPIVFLGVSVRLFQEDINI